MISRTYPHPRSRPYLRLGWAGVSRFYGHRVLESSQESLPVLMEADANLNRFFPYMGAKNGSNRQTPNPPASVSWGRRVAFTPRLPTLRPGFHLTVQDQGALVALSLRSTATRRHVRLQPAARDIASLSRWQSASSTPPPRAVAGFSWTSPATLEMEAPQAPHFFLACSSY